MERDNMFRACIRICIAFNFLCGFVVSTSSKSFETGEETRRKSNQISDSVRYEHHSDSLSVFATNSCVNTFENQTVSSKLSVQGCNTLSLQNVTITSNGDLTLSAPDAISINGAFEVNPGGMLNIKTELTQWSFDYGYDNAGNRIRRSANSLKLSDMN